jgi:hypothetical protein
MLQPLKQNARRGQVSQTVFLPAPVGGWNVRDPLPAMKPTDAIELINLVPGTGACSLRKGYSVFATGMTLPVESLMQYGTATGVNKLFAGVATKIYNVTTGTPVEAVTSLTNARWQHTNFTSTAGTNYLVIANGEDSVRNYDGTTWTTPSITGVTSSTLINVSTHMKRLFFTQKDTLSVWYLPVGSISGAATELPMGSYFNKGGHVVATSSWTRDGGAGPEDLFVIYTSQGQVAIWSGTDPTSAATAALVGIFNLPRPLGRRCMTLAGSEVMLLTEVGVLPLSAALSQADTQQSWVTVSDKIINQFTDAARRVGENFGWGLTEAPREQLLVVNVPLAENEEQEQYVMNTAKGSGAWCRFYNLNMNCWVMFGGDLYGGGNSGQIIRYGGGNVDGEDLIEAALRQAFTDFGSPDQKRFVKLRIRAHAPRTVTPNVTLKTDYDITEVAAPAPSPSSAVAQWDVAEWDVASWADQEVPIMVWRGCSSQGVVAGPAYTISQDVGFTLFGTDVMFEDGGTF